MKYQGCLLSVKDISASKHFYEKVLHQNAVMDIGIHVTFEGFSLQQGYAELVGITVDSVKEQSHNFQVYFEVEDLDKVYAEMKSISSLQFLSFYLTSLAEHLLCNFFNLTAEFSAIL